MSSDTDKLLPQQDLKSNSTVKTQIFNKSNTNDQQEEEQEENELTTALPSIPPPTDDDDDEGDSGPIEVLPPGLLAPAR